MPGLLGKPRPRNPHKNTSQVPKYIPGLLGKPRLERQVAQIHSRPAGQREETNPSG